MSTEQEPMNDQAQLRRAEEREDILHRIWMAQARTVLSILESTPYEEINAATLTAANKFLKDNGMTLGRFEEEARQAKETRRLSGKDWPFQGESDGVSLGASADEDPDRSASGMTATTTTMMAIRSMPFPVGESGGESEGEDYYG